VTITEALRDRNLFGALPAFRDLSSWSSWIVFLKAVYGIALDPGELAVFTKHTGRLTPRPSGYSEAVAVVGRQSGKTRCAALLATFEAITAEPEGDRTELYALLVAQDHRAALRSLLRYAAAPFALAPMLAQVVVTQTADTITLTNGATIAAYPCRPAAVRGLRARVVAVDEMAFFTATDGRPTDTEMLRALRPCLATTGGKLIVLSSPYAQSGQLWELHRRHHGREDSSTLVWQASAPDMNPTLPADYLERMREDDPEAYRSEVLGEFRAGVSTFLNPEALADCVAKGRRENPPSDGVAYCMYADPASGSGKDAFAAAAAHRDGSRIVLDVVRAWRPPFNPSGAIAEVAELAKRYGCYTIKGDRYAPGFVVEGCAAQGIEYQFSELDRSRLYLEFLPHVNAGAVELPDDPNLLRELRGLERRRGASGRDRVDHRPGNHDDLANAAAGAVVLAASDEFDILRTYELLNS
jgi:Terminase large subunit, T4likevirus-type, N-terminal